MYYFFTCETAIPSPMKWVFDVIKMMSNFKQGGWPGVMPFSRKQNPLKGGLSFDKCKLYSFSYN